jgi:plasmid stability protein
MARHLQIRDVPEALHRKLETRAAMAGKSLSDYLLDEMHVIAERPTMEEVVARLAEFEQEAVRAEREAIE